jgi:hypothetical protein
MAMLHLHLGVLVHVTDGETAAMLRLKYFTIWLTCNRSLEVCLRTIWAWGLTQWGLGLRGGLSEERWV